ncbi:hypothetical protein DEA98_29285 (plasmid) [Brucella pseudogrignonensis]|nr:hypothetical protein [Brucella pseudogrignonensis]
MSGAVGSTPAKRARLGFEVKWDGYRLAIHVEPNRLRVLTRGGHDWTPDSTTSRKPLWISATLQ